MTISAGDALPAGSLTKLGENGPEAVDLATLTKGRKVVLFGLPGAFTGTCSSAHLPSFMRTAEAFRAKGVDEIICLSVNDPFVMAAWDDATGASKSGITMLTDPMGDLVQAMDLAFTAPPVGFVNRSRRFAALVEDGVVKTINVEESPGTCEISAGETLLDAA